jgi:hypothetical protein
MGFVVDKVALGQVFSEYFGFPCQSSFHQLLHNHRRSSGAGTIGQQWPTYQVDLGSHHPEKLKKQNQKKISYVLWKEREVWEIMLQVENKEQSWTVYIVKTLYVY